MAHDHDRTAALAELTGPGGRFEITEQEVLGRRMRAYAVAPATLREVLLRFPASGARDHLVYAGERHSYAGVFDRVAAVAAYLAAEHGVGRGARVALAMRNYPEFVVFFWAAQALGAICVPLNAWWTAPELLTALGDCEPAVLVVDDERLERLAGQLPENVVSVRSSREVAGVVRYEDLDLPAGQQLPAGEVGPDDLSTIIYTSGTTGYARGAMHTHRNHVTNLLNTQLLSALDPGPGSDGQPGLLAHMPLFHITQLASLYIGAAAGAKLVLMYRWDAETALDLIEREQLTSFGGVPMQVRAVLDSPSLAGRDLSRLRSIGVGAAAVAPETVLRVGSTFGGRIAAATGYGMTEATSAVTYISGAEYLEHPDSVGKPMPVDDIKIMLDGAELAPGEAGELWVRGPNVVPGYWRHPEATARAFVDGWHRTGDVARLDGEGRVHLVDRVKDIVIRAGENVYCGEVEAVLYDHPAVHTVAVIGLPDPRLGEEVTAVVRLRPGATATAAELQAHVAGRLARFKVPSRIVFTSGDVPRTPTGKVLKRALRDAVVQRLSNGSDVGGPL